MKKQRMRSEFLGINIDLLTMQETLERVDKIIKAKNPVQHVVVNVAKIVNAQKDSGLRNIINSCELINVDGMGVIWGAKILGIDIPERVAGIDLMECLVEHSSQNGYKLFFFGAKEEIVSDVVNIYKTKYPELLITGYRNGYYTDDEEANIAAEIKNSNADILFVAMGSPQKELFLNKYVKHMQIPFVMGVGGSFDVVAGKVQRAPLWMQKSGLEWFYRLVQEPRRMWKRYLVTNILFLGIILKEFLTKNNKM